MQIHVVRPGDSLYRIAQNYGVSPNVLIQSNEIQNPNNLVVGQTIVIPFQGNFHTVRSGESLDQISRRYGVSVEEIMRANRITNPNQIMPGLRLYIPSRPRPTVDVGAYIDPRITGDRSADVVDDVAENLTFLQIFNYAVNRDGTLTPVDD